MISYQGPGEPGTAKTGGGGGGAPTLYNKGGSGVVIVRYTSAPCIDQSCGTDYYHDGSDCVACPTGSTRLPDTDNECLCPENYHRKVDGGVYSCAAQGLGIHGFGAQRAAAGRHTHTPSAAGASPS